jgi:hypothetical protein
VVVKAALGHVQHLFRRQTNARQGLPKVVQRWLVALYLLRGDDPIERDVELLIGAGKQVVVGVGDDRKPETTPERPQGRLRIGERRPVTDRVGKPRLFSRGGREAQALAEVPEDRHQQLAIRRVGTSLGSGLQLGVERQESFGVGRHTVVPQDRLKRGEDARLPVDQRPVAVEGQHPLGREVDHVG